MRALAPSEVIRIGPDGALSGELFERCLDDLLHRTMREDGGVLFVLRNEGPTVLLSESAVTEAATALYHDNMKHRALLLRRAGPPRGDRSEHRQGYAWCCRGTRAASCATSTCHRG